MYLGKFFGINIRFFMCPLYKWMPITTKKKIWFGPRSICPCCSLWLRIPMTGIIDLIFILSFWLRDWWQCQCWKAFDASKYFEDIGHTCVDHIFIVLKDWRCLWRFPHTEIFKTICRIKFWADWALWWRALYSHLFVLTWVIKFRFFSIQDQESDTINHEYMQGCKASVLK